MARNKSSSRFKSTHAPKPKIVKKPLPPSTEENLLSNEEIESIIKYELIGCIIWILGHGIHQIQTGRADHSAVYSLCVMRG